MYHISEVNNMVSAKRPEENYKFVFKRCLKHMKEQLRSRVGGSNRPYKRDFEAYFNKYYFEEVVEEPHRPIESFLHPKNANNNCRNAAKTINSQYIANIVRSAKFVGDFLEYLNHGLENDYRRVICSKIRGLIEKWEADFQTAPDKALLVQRICENIERNNKCKLPWTVIEVRSAIASANLLLKESRGFSPVPTAHSLRLFPASG